MLDTSNNLELQVDWKKMTYYTWENHALKK